MEHRKVVLTQRTDEGAGLRLTSRIGALGALLKSPTGLRKEKQSFPHSMAMILALSPIQHLLRKHSTPTDQPTSFLNMPELLETRVCLLAYD